MFDQNIAGIMLRRERLLRNWSQETLCKGLCSVSYLSKIEQGKVAADEQLLMSLFERMEIIWQKVSQEESVQLCETLYELAFSNETEKLKEEILSVNPEQYGAYSVDILVLKSYCYGDPDLVPTEIHLLLDNRQRCLLYLAEEKPVHALQIYPCALAALYAGVYAYAQGDYAVALEYLQNGYHMASSEGYVRIMMYCEAYISNCYADLQNIPSMLKHNKIIRRLANALGEIALLRDIEYNLRCTQMERGEYDAPYEFFSKIEDPSVLELHKLAICCENTGRKEAALEVLDRAFACAEGIDVDMCKIVQYRLLHPEFLKEREYGEQLLQLFNRLKEECPAGFARFHLPWIEEWCTANRQYRTVYEIMHDFL